MMRRFWTILCILYMCFIILRYSNGLPLYLLQLCGRVFYTGLKTEASLCSRLLSLFLIELVSQGVECVACLYWGSSAENPEKEPLAKENTVTQTNGQWLKKTRRQDRIHSELARVIKEESKRTRQHRVTIIKKYRLKSFHIKNDGESKTKLMASVNKKVVSLALEIDGLMNRVQEKRLILDRQREENKRVLQRYEQLYHDIQNRYMYEP